MLLVASCPDSGIPVAFQLGREECFKTQSRLEKSGWSNIATYDREFTKDEVDLIPRLLMAEFSPEARTALLALGIQPF